VLQGLQQVPEVLQLLQSAAPEEAYPPLAGAFQRCCHLLEQHAVQPGQHHELAAALRSPAHCTALAATDSGYYSP
jgi:hypothetical protein